MNLMIIFQSFPTLMVEYSFNVEINSSKLYIQPNIMHSRRTANNNAKLFRNVSNIANIRLPQPVANTDEMHVPTIHTIVAVFLREKANFSDIE